ncbi:Ribonucleoside-diphosphate reductase subunit beta nrdF2 [Acholeplasma oculi]|uniref:ribonucleoside-diphosphate reductase n=1 Tax=Acholeplasma oculi TaxID=35623 RepID=A0A061A8H4_9MOLU|nr:class 1b ribonucleoside-diphosphate reductase subunit beta [Acholeplasma oculi]CDR30185.1 Ribonucleotide reductase class Ib (aerobic), beta subunit [Acholeplasma oculi]SKC44134.1 ribonucleoside-diphosphate reductase beta chain [Acholeplasma oculi]SUT88538.1 Ribonucleoside-diphosphate reductase subunit beta nrdF2 [Acholeplasma oculi]
MKKTTDKKIKLEPVLDVLYNGANWNQKEDDYTQHFYEQNLSQFWRPEDISLQPDLNVWHVLPEKVQLAYARNLLVLTFLDTHQGDIGMPVVSRSLDDHFHQRKAVINFMAAMENAVHAKSYSNIFMTYMSTPDIDDLFLWGEKHPNLQNIMKSIVGYYKELDRYNYLKKFMEDSKEFNEVDFNVAQWKAMVASVFLETWLFYSGFYYPLFFYGQGKLMQAGEIINLILRDESIHGLYIGRLAQEIYETFDNARQEALQTWLYEFLLELYHEQNELVESIYDEVELSHDVKVFVRYNANKALMNLGFDPYFEQEEVNPVVLNGLNTETKTMDNFSMKGNGYQKMKSEMLKDSDFEFKQEKIIKFGGKK